MAMTGSSAAPPLPAGRKTGTLRDNKSSPSDAQVCTIREDGDLILVCSPSQFQKEGLKEASSSFRVSSTILRNASGYFATLLDPNKFHEGKTIWETNVALDAKYGSRDAALQLASTDELAHVKLELPPLATKPGKLGLMETFVRILTWSHRESASGENSDFLSSIGDMPISFLASLAVVFDRLGAVPALVRALRGSRTDSKNLDIGSMSKISRRLRSYDSENEGRLRQAICLAFILDDKDAMRHTTHKLIIKGSKEWSFDACVQHAPGIERALWWHLPHGIEEELCFRHQCILNTIADLQNHLVAAYGAFPPTEGRSPSRQVQCPRAYGNSHACDSFHLGEMIRFFSSRTRTICLESSLSNPEIDSDNEDDSSSQPVQLSSAAKTLTQGLTFPHSAHTSQSPATNIANLISSLRKCPEYQIDPHHAGCGIRRRLVPALDCFEVFTNSQSSVLGICLFHWKQGNRSWRDKRSSRLGVTIDRTGFIEVGNRGPTWCNCVPRAEDARALFITKHRQWNL